MTIIDPIIAVNDVEASSCLATTLYESNEFALVESFLC